MLFLKLDLGAVLRRETGLIDLCIAS